MIFSQKKNSDISDLITTFESTLLSSSTTTTTIETKIGIDSNSFNHFCWRLGWWWWLLSYHHFNAIIIIIIILSIVVVTEFIIIKPIRLSSSSSSTLTSSIDCYQHSNNCSSPFWQPQSFLLLENWIFSVATFILSIPFLVVEAKSYAAVTAAAAAAGNPTDAINIDDQTPPFASLSSFVFDPHSKLYPNISIQQQKVVDCLISFDSTIKFIDHHSDLFNISTFRIDRTSYTGLAFFFNQCFRIILKFFVVLPARFCLDSLWLYV